MTIVDIITAIIVLLGLSSGIVVLLSDPRDKVRRYYFYLAVCMVGFVVVNSFTDSVYLSEASRTVFLRLSLGLKPFLSSIFLLFIVTFLGLKNDNRVVASIDFVVQLFLFFSILFSPVAINSDLLLKGVTYAEDGTQILLMTDLEYLYFALLAVPVLLGLGILIKVFQDLIGQERVKVGFVLLGSLVTSCTSLGVQLLEMNNPLGVFEGIIFLRPTVLWEISRSSFIVFFLCTSYAILRHRLFGIRVVLGKSLLWFGISAFFFTGFYLVVWVEQLFLDDIFSPTGIFVNVIVATLMAIIFSMYEKQLQDRIYNNILYARYDPEQVMASLIQKISMDQSLNTIVAKLFETFEHTIRAGKIFVMVLPKSKDAVEPQSFALKFASTELSQIESDEVINTLLESSTMSLNLDRGFESLGDNVSEILAQSGVDAIYTEDHDDAYVLVLLGKKADGSSYTREEVVFAGNVIHSVAPYVSRARL